MPETKHHESVKGMLHDMVNKFALTQAQIAEFCGISQPAVSIMMKGGGARDSTYRKLVKLYKREYPLYAKRIRNSAKALDDETLEKFRQDAINRRQKR
jgi:predicted transcriptional regulator